MAAPPKVTLPELAQALARARRQLAARNFSQGGDIYRDFAEPLDTLARFIEQQEALAMKPLDPVTLREGSDIWTQVRNWGLEAEVIKIGQLSTLPDGTRCYRIEIKDLGALEGTATQIIKLLRNMPMRPSPDMAALAYQQIEQPEPPEPPAEPTAMPEYQGERVIIATTRSR